MIDFLRRIGLLAKVPVYTDKAKELGLLDAPYSKRAYGLVEFRNLKLDDLAPEVRASYVDQINQARPAIEWMLKEMIAAQIEKWSREAWSVDKQLAFHNGGMNGFDLVLEGVEVLSAESEENHKPEPVIDATKAPLSSGADLDVI